MSYEFQCGRACDKGGFGAAVHHLAYNRTVVGLGVMHDEIIELSSVERVRNIFRKLSANRNVRSIQKSGFFVFYYIGIISHSLGYRKQIFKQRFCLVARAYIIYVVKQMSFHGVLRIINVFSLAYSCSAVK